MLYFIASLALVIFVSEGIKKKIKNPRDVSRFKKSILKKAKNEKYGKIFFCELGEDDRDYYYKYLCMSPDNFDHLFNFVALLIIKQDTNY